MRNTGPFTQYNRAITKRKNMDELPDVQQPPLDKSLLGVFGALESKFLTSFVEWAEADGTTYT